MRPATLVSFSVVFGVLAAGSAASAHSAGQSSSGCMGCHGAGSDYPISASVDPQTFGPGQQVSVTVTIAPGFGANAGVFVAANGGTLATVGGQGLGLVPAGLTHTSPKGLSNGQASFVFLWTAPSAPGAVRFDVSTLVGNGNGSSSGDSADRAYFDFVYGCQPATYYADNDSDGFGDSDQPRVHCDTSPPTGYAPAGGDCDDFRDTTFPGAVEYCNQRDDDCDGVVDDDAIPFPLYPDADGDGYYSTAEFTSGESIIGCVPTAGWAAEGIDCAPDDPAINPGVEEVCNNIDDNCDARIDEYVRPRCGEGWCEREAYTCAGDMCFPGTPKAEECNLFDDDCDGIVDNGELCPAGQACVAAQCVADPGAAPAPAAPKESDSGCAVGGQGSVWLLVGWLVALMRLVSRRARR